MATRGVSLLVSPKSYAKRPRVSVGQAAGSQASTSISRPAIFSRRNGKARPAKFEPPPTQPTTTSGKASARSEERRVGKECRCGGSPSHKRKKRGRKESQAQRSFRAAVVRRTENRGGCYTRRCAD